MCGIIGASNNEQIDFSAIRLGMLNADDRGGHSCGIAVRGEERHIVREVANAKTFINDTCLDEADQIPRNNTSFIGHTRWATQGEKSIPNTHPFAFGNIVGVHNGSLSNFKSLKSRYINQYRNTVADWYGSDWKQGLGVDRKVDIKLESDSKLLYWMIWKFGIREALPKFRGTMALVFFKEEQGEEYLYFYRFKKPLCYGRRDDGLWLGSLKKYMDSLGCKKIKNVTEHALYKVKDGSIITSKQLPQDKKPMVNTAAKTDYDEAFKPEGAGKKSGSQSSGGRMHDHGYGYLMSSKSEKDETGVCNVDDTPWRDPKEISEGTELDFEQDGFRFCAPKHAKGDTNRYGNLVLYWFSNNNPHIVYIEEQGKDDVAHYDLRQTTQVRGMRTTHPEIADLIMDDYEQLEITLDFRENIEANAEE